MSSTTRLAAMVTALGSAAMSVSACGHSFGQQPADDIVTAARKATTATTSVHVTGRVTLKGESYLVDLHLSRAGACRGTFARKDARMEVLLVEDRTFFRGDPERLEQGGLATPKQLKVLDGPRSVWLEGAWLRPAPSATWASCSAPSTGPGSRRGPSGDVEVSAAGRSPAWEW